MCFSAEASFGLSAILLPAGAYCVWSAVERKKALLALAIIPLGFSAQQFCEGLAWTGIDQGDLDLARRAAFFYLFFALAFWLFWIPFCAFLTAENARNKGILACFAFLGFAGGVVLYLPLLLNPEVLILTVRSHSIFYDITQSAMYQMLPLIWWRILYLVIVAIPMVVSPSQGFLLFGIALLVAAVVSQFIYWYAFTSVWCFFAAILSVHLCFSFRRLP